MSEDPKDTPKGHPVPPDGPASEAGILREQDVTQEDRLDEGDLSESEKLPGE